MSDVLETKSGGHDQAMNREMSRLRPKPPWWWAGLYYLFLAGLVVVFAVGIDQFGHILVAPFLGLALLFAVVYAAVRVYCSALFKFSATMSPETFGEKVIRLDAAGIEVSTTHSKSFVAWKGIAAVRKGKHAIYFFTTPLTAMSASPSGFESAAAYDAFAAKAEALRAAAHAV